MADIGRIASPMNICEEDLWDTTNKVEKEKSLFKKLQGLKPATFMVGSIEKVNQRISDLDDELSLYDEKLVIESRQSNKSFDSAAKGIPIKPLTPNKIKEEKQVEHFAELYAVKSTTTPEVQPMKKLGKPTKATKQKQKADMPQLVELQQFPGWNEIKYTPLPHGLSVTLVLDHVVLAQKNLKRKPFYAKEFKRLIYSKIHCGMLQDSFWWYFINKYHPDKENQVRLFGRIAYNFVRLFLDAEQPRYRNLFFMEYGKLLAQCIYSTFCLAFPQSWRQFDEASFKENLCQLTSVWVTGIRQPPRQYESWHHAELEPKGMRKEEVMKSINKNDKDKSSVGRISPSSSITSANKSLLGHSRKGSNKTPSTRGNQSAKGPQASARSLAQKTDAAPSERNTLSPITEAPNTLNEGSTTKVKPMMKIKSCAANNPVILSRNVFNINGRSPLLVEFFRQYDLDSCAKPDVLMRHTLIDKIPNDDAYTYSDIINESKRQVDQVSKEYGRLFSTYQRSKRNFDFQQKNDYNSFWMKANKLLSKPQKVHHLSNLILMEMKRDADEVIKVGAAAALQNALTGEGK